VTERRNPAIPHARIPRAVLRDRRLSLGARILYAIIEGRCVKNRTTFATVSTFAEDIGIALRTAKTYLHELTTRGLILTERRGRGQSAYRTLARVETVYATGELHRGLHRDGPQAAPHEKQDGPPTAPHKEQDGPLTARETGRPRPGEAVTLKSPHDHGGPGCPFLSKAKANGVPTVLADLVARWPDAGQAGAMPRVRQLAEANPVQLRAFAEGVERDRVAGTVRVPWTCLAERIAHGYDAADSDYASARVAVNGGPGKGGAVEQLGEILPATKGAAS